MSKKSTVRAAVKHATKALKPVAEAKRITRAIAQVNKACAPFSGIEGELSALVEALIAQRTSIISNEIERLRRQMGE